MTDPSEPLPSDTLDRVAGRFAKDGTFDVIARRGRFATVQLLNSEGEIHGQVVLFRWDNGGWGLEQITECRPRS